MSNTAYSFTSVAQPATQAKPVPGWKQLAKLLPYIARFKGQVAVGMVALAAMGVVGTLHAAGFRRHHGLPVRERPAPGPLRPDLACIGAH